jgi:hypothetical protein
MLGEPACHRRKLGPHEGEQLSGVHARHIQRPHDTRPRSRAAHPANASLRCQVSALLALTDHAVEAVKTIVFVLGRRLWDERPADGRRAGRGTDEPPAERRAAAR